MASYYEVNLSCHLFKSTDAGATWTDISANTMCMDLRTNNAGDAFGTSDPDIIVDNATDGGVFQTVQPGLRLGGMDVVDSGSAVWVVGQGGSIHIRSGATTVPQWVSGPTEWDPSASSAFGFCPQDAGLGATAEAAYPEDGNNTCTANQADPWYPIPPALTKVAATSGIGNAGRYDIVWGFRAGSGQAAGVYRATVLIEALSPST
jgi:hypothetical protein